MPRTLHDVRCQDKHPAVTAAVIRDVGIAEARVGLGSMSMECTRKPKSLTRTVGTMAYVAIVSEVSMLVCKLFWELSLEGFAYLDFDAHAAFMLEWERGMSFLPLNYTCQTAPSRRSISP